MQQTDKNVLGRYLCRVLRHRPELIGIDIDEHGWADVETLLKGVNERYFINRPILEEIVRTDEKMRYSFNEDATKIRCNQGHSITVDLELKPVQPPEFLFHGTANQWISSVREKGLLKMKRNYVHFSLDYDTAVSVGKRHGKPVVFKIHAAHMAWDGFLFYRAVNGVWLTDYVPPQYLELME